MPRHLFPDENVAGNNILFKNGSTTQVVIKCRESDVKGGLQRVKDEKGEKIKVKNLEYEKQMSLESLVKLLSQWCLQASLR